MPSNTFNNKNTNSSVGKCKFTVRFAFLIYNTSGAFPPMLGIRKETSSELILQITLFLNAVNQYQPNVNVLGFYEINRGLFGSVNQESKSNFFNINKIIWILLQILSLLVTYLIVLVQLNSSFAPAPPNTGFNNNTIT